MLTARDPLPGLPRRVTVAGVSGTGKTTLAAAIGEALGVPHVEIDALYHGPDWVPRPSFVADVEAFTATDCWVTEWQYAAARPVVAARAEVLVWLDLPFRVTLGRVSRRTLLRRVRRERLWNGNVEPPLRTVLTDPEHVVRWAVATRGRYRQLVPQVARLHPPLVVVRLGSRREVVAWLAALRTTADRPRYSPGPKPSSSSPSSSSS